VPHLLQSHRKETRSFYFFYTTSAQRSERRNILQLIYYPNVIYPIGTPHYRQPLHGPDTLQRVCTHIDGDAENIILAAELLMEDIYFWPEIKKKDVVAI